MNLRVSSSESDLNRWFRVTESIWLLPRISESVKSLEFGGKSLEERHRAVENSQRKAMEAISERSVLRRDRRKSKKKV